MNDARPASLCANLINEMRSLQLSTVADDGTPHCGYTPYVHHAPCSFYIFVSQLSVHTRDLLANKTVAIMIIADEESSSEIFARTRVSYLCDVRPILPAHPDYEPVLKDYEERHGKTVALLRQLPDFVLFQLHPRSGQFVMGFGQAYRVTGEDMSVFEHTRTG